MKFEILGWLTARPRAQTLRAGVWLLAVLAAAGTLGSRLCAASPFSDRILSWYQPLAGEAIALSPDGSRIAFTRHERSELVLYLASVDQPTRKIRIAVDDDEPVLFSREKRPSRLRLLRWVSPSRLVFSPRIRSNGSFLEASIFAVNTDGSEPRRLARQEDFSYLLTPEGASTSIVVTRPTTFLPSVVGKRNTLLIEAAGRVMGRNIVPTAVFALEGDTGKLNEVHQEDPGGRYFYTRQGEPRVFYSMPRLAEKRRFEFNLGGTWGRWAEMNVNSIGPAARHFQVTLDNYFGERAFPVGFSPNPDVLYFASNVGRDTYGLYALHLRSKEPIPFSVEEPHVDLALLEPGFSQDSLVFDAVSGELAGIRGSGLTRFTRWLDPALGALQRDFERMFPRRTVEIIQWDDARTRFLLHVVADGEPGRYHVFSRAENVMFEVLRSAPWINAGDLNDVTTFEFDTPAGVHLSGYLTLPRRPRLNPPPLLIAFSENPMTRAQSGFDREAQILAEMGFVVARINHRGVGGFGVKHRAAVRTEGERAPVDDAVAVVNWIAQRQAIDRRRVATYGRGLGGYLALRALQLSPDTFRCGVAINSPLSPKAWLQPPLETIGRGPDQPAEQGMGRPPPSPPPPPINFTLEVQRAFYLRGVRGLDSVMADVDRLTLPVMLVVDEGGDRTIAAQNLELRGRLRRLDRVVEYYKTGAGFAPDLPVSQSKMFREMEGFFNLHLYDFNVKVGPTREVK